MKWIRDIIGRENSSTEKVEYTVEVYYFPSDKKYIVKSLEIHGVDVIRQTDTVYPQDSFKGVAREAVLSGLKLSDDSTEPLGESKQYSNKKSRLVEIQRDENVLRMQRMVAESGGWISSLDMQLAISLDSSNDTIYESICQLLEISDDMKS